MSSGMVDPFLCLCQRCAQEPALHDVAVAVGYQHVCPGCMSDHERGLAKEQGPRDALAAPGHTNTPGHP